MNEWLGSRIGAPHMGQWSLTVIFHLFLLRDMVVHECP